MDQGSPWTLAYLASTLAMWVVMMTAMMLPSATPMLHAASDIRQGSAGATQVRVSTLAMACGYVAAWAGFSVFATALQAELRARSLLSPQLSIIDIRLGAFLLLTAGVFELTPLKAALLARCRAPASTLQNAWHDGRSGALRMGFEQGASCVACCWPLMLVLFVVGAMNPLWIAVFGLLVALEKVATGDCWPRRLAGGSLIACGILLAAGRL